MTDKEKIRKEVARIQLYTQSEVLKQVLDYIDSLQEEPVAPKVLEDMLNAKTAAESLGISQEEHDRIVNELIYGKEPELVDVDDLPNMEEEPVSEELEEAAEDYAATDEVLPNGKVMINFQAEKAFRAGAKWQKEQMMKDAVEVQVNNDPIVGRYINMSSSVVLDTLNQLNSDKAKLIIIKED